MAYRIGRGVEDRVVGFQLLLQTIADTTSSRVDGNVHRWCFSTRSLALVFVGVVVYQVLFGVLDPLFDLLILTLLVLQLLFDPFSLWNSQCRAEILLAGWFERDILKELVLVGDLFLYLRRYWLVVFRKERVFDA